jgi:Rps23 Pro-64 3,4-dihydroxylase Tpa1-like proline 4-hydroxylase
MTPKQILDSFSETLVQDERILSQRERALLSSLLHHAKQTPNQNPETHEAVHAVFASAVGETIAQRAFAVLGSSVVDRILAPTATSAAFPDRTVYGMPIPPSPGPQPPGSKPPTPPASAPQPPSPRPLTDTPKEPQPPGHGLYPLEFKGQGKLRESPPRNGVGVLDGPEVENPAVLTAQCVVLNEFLAPEELNDLTAYTLEHEADFRTSEVVSPSNSGVIDYEHRRSRVLSAIGKHERVIAERVKGVLPLVLAKLGMEEFSLASLESQITASNDGDFFRVHPDNGHAEVAARHLTFVYFFHREPKQFEGGELRIHDAKLNGGHDETSGKYQTIVPQQNQVVFFPCSTLHEIAAVKCPTRAFADSRFTLNGWLHR